MDTGSFIIEIPDTPQGLSNFLVRNKEHFNLSECENKDMLLYHHLQEKKAQMSTEEFEVY